MSQPTIEGNYSILLFFDALGVRNYTPTEFVRYFHAIKEVREALNKEFANFQTKMSETIGIPPFKLVVVADNILIAWQPDKKSDDKVRCFLPAFAYFGDFLFCELLKRKIMTRGFLSIGTFFSQESLWLGYVIVKANDVTSKHEWFGFVVDKDLSDDIRNINKELNLDADFWFPYDVPTKEPRKDKKILEDKYWVTAWPKRLSDYATGLDRARAESKHQNVQEFVGSCNDRPPAKSEFSVDHFVECTKKLLPRSNNISEGVDITGAAVAKDLARGGNKPLDNSSTGTSAANLFSGPVSFEIDSQ